MKRSNRLVILVGVLLAVLAFVLVFILLNQQPEVVAPEEPPTVTVLVARDTIEIGDAVTPELVEEAEVAPDAVVATRFADVSQLRGQPAIFRLPAGSQVTQELIGLGAPGAVSIADRLQPGEKAIAIQVERVTGLDFLVAEGDHVDVVISQQITVLQPTAEAPTDDEEAPGPQRFETVTGLEDVRTVKTVLQNKRVVYVSQSRLQAPAPEPEPGEPEQPPAEEAPIDRVIIVFAGTDQDAELIKFAQRDLAELGALTVVIRHADDEEEEETTGITIDLLVEQYGVPIPGIVQDLGPTP